MLTRLYKKYVQMNFTGGKNGQKTSGTGKFECKTCVHLKFVLQNLRAGKLHTRNVQKYILYMPRLQNLRSRQIAYKTSLHFPKYVLLLVFKTSGTGKLAHKTGLHFPKYILLLVFKNLQYHQICMQNVASFLPL